MNNKLRPLKPIEQKLLKKVDFLNWETDGTPEQRRAMLKVIAKFNLRDQTEFFNYAKISKQVNDTIKELKGMTGGEYDSFKKEQLSLLAQKLFQMGVLDSENEMEDASFKGLTVSRFCRRRFSYMMKTKKFCESVKIAEKYIAHGHVRVGPEIISDPAFIITRTLEDFIAWTSESKIRRSIAEYKDEVDDYDLLGA